MSRKHKDTQDINDVSGQVISECCLAVLEADSRKGGNA
jgi:hypothetical protein